MTIVETLGDCAYGSADNRRDFAGAQRTLTAATVANLTLAIRRTSKETASNPPLMPHNSLLRRVMTALCAKLVPKTNYSSNRDRALWLP